ncbi:MAG: hypothetical protein ABIO57_03360 [Candidatus Paceibacterota bacterium]
MNKTTEENKALLLEQLRKTPIVQIACEKLDISRATFYRWKAEDEAFATSADQAVSEGRLLINDVAESQLIGAVKDRNLAAIMYWLKHHHGDYKTKVQIDGRLETIHEMSPEQKVLVEQALKLAGIVSEEHHEES